MAARGLEMPHHRSMPRVYSSRRSITPLQMDTVIACTLLTTYKSKRQDDFDMNITIWSSGLFHSLT
jgi:hypothetical protein